MIYKCPFCGIGKRKIADIKTHVGDIGGKCFYWGYWVLNEH